MATTMNTIDELVERIDIVYESRKIYTAIVVSDENLDTIYDSLESRMYPCLLMSHATQQEIEDLPNKTILCTTDEYTSHETNEILRDVNVDCVFFVGLNTFTHCVNHIVGKQRQQFIFTL